MLSKIKIYNLFLRGLTIGLRFLFVFFIGKKVSLEMLGSYSLWTTTIAISIMFIGFDFYTYSTRELLKVEKEKQWSLIRNHGVLIMVSYVLLLPILLWIFQFDLLDSRLIYWFYGVLVLEHLGSELYRLFNTLQKPLLANFLLFIRSAIWMILLYILWSGGVKASMETILSYWFVGAMVSFMMGIYSLLKMYKGISGQPIDWQYIKVGLRASSVLLLGTLSLKTIELSDRYMIDHFIGKEELGAFSFFYQITNLISVVIYTVVIVILYPKLFHSIYHDQSKIGRMKNTILKQSLLIFVVLSLLVLALSPLLIDWMERSLLVERFEVIYPMLGAVFFFNVFLIYKLFLNAWSIDGKLLKVIFLGAMINFALNLWGIPRYGIFAASMASMVSYVILAIGTFVLTKKEFISRKI